MKDASAKSFTAQQEAAILRLYVKQRRPWVEVAARLGLIPHHVRKFLLSQGAMRPRGSVGRVQKLSPAQRRRLEAELPSAPNFFLARKYGVTKERIRQIREELGLPSGKSVARKWRAAARAGRR